MISLFGYPRVIIDGHEIHFKRRKTLALLAYLAVRNRPQTRETLATVLWPYMPDKSAAQNLRNLLTDIRATPLTDLLYTEGDEVSLDETLEIDIHQFDQCVRQIQNLDAYLKTVPPEYLAYMERAVLLYGEGLLAGFQVEGSPEYDDWQYLNAHRYQHVALGILGALAHHYVLNKVAERAHAAIERWLTIDPVAEHAHRLLMQLYIEEDAPDEALHQYQTLARMLERQDGTQPLPETKVLYENIRSGMFDRPRVEMPVQQSLHSILPGQPAHLVGRDQDLAALKRSLGIDDTTQRKPVVVVSGEPGVGKSALAAQLAYDPEVRAAFKDGVLWATLGPEPDLYAIFHLWMSALDVSELKDVTDTEPRAMHLAAVLYDKNMLLVVDDVWSLYDARLFTLAKTRSTVVITTRFPTLAQQIATELDAVYSLAPLTDEASGLLLAYRAPQLVAPYPEQAAQIVKICHGLPLVLNLVADAFNRRQMVEPGPGLAGTLVDPVQLLDQPIVSELLVSRETSSLRKVLAAMWARTPEGVRQHVNDIVDACDDPDQLDLTMLRTLLGAQADTILENLLSSGFLIRRGNSLRLNPFLVMFIKTQRATLR